MTDQLVAGHISIMLSSVSNANYSTTKSKIFKWNYNIHSDKNYCTKYSEGEVNTKEDYQVEDLRTATVWNQGEFSTYHNIVVNQYFI